MLYTITKKMTKKEIKIFENIIWKKRLITREYNMFGERMLEGGDMHVQFKRFLKWAMNYEENEESYRYKKRSRRYRSV